ncbi:hypothetical protein WK13_34905 [Burkholderia ubonensis]|uniref:proline-rich domain-containing protein n=1 Tax=Burkholderia ubonensis TaxID=101571 RepID=UPI0007558458|nr:proline-rich domain-containing protein [Burkholderia ubonensis]KVR21731.1 hypothetical protein WK13_34905 [Burkholderia ubonensis]
MANAVLNRDIYWLDTKISLSNVREPANIEIGRTAMLGGGRSAEIIRVDGFDQASGLLTIARGCLDTVPQRWPRATQIWFYEDYIGTDGREYAEGEQLAVKVLTRTTSSKLAVEDSATYGVTMQARFTRPYAPGLVKINGQPFYVGAKVSTGADGQDAVLTWAHRDRVGQADKVIDHLMGDIGPENGAEYGIELYGENGVKFWETRTRNNSWTFSKDWLQNALGGPGTHHGLTVRLFSIRNGYESWQWYNIALTVDTQEVQVKQLARLMAFPAKIVDGNLEVPPDQPEQPGKPSIAPLLIYEWPYLDALLAGRVVPSTQGYVGTAMSRDLLPANDYGVATARTGEALQERKTAQFVPCSLVTAYPPRWDSKGNQIGEQVTPFATQISLIKPSRIGGMRAGQLAMLGSSANGEAMEIVLIEEVDTLKGSLKIRRGCLDTIPRGHPAGQSYLWFYESNAYGTDDRTYTEGESVAVAGIPHQANPPTTGNLSVDLAAREYRPYPAGLFRIADNPWFNGVAVYQGFTTVFTWAERNRIDQGSRIVDHFATDCTREPGVSYRITLSYGETILREFSGIMDTSFPYSPWMAQADHKRASELRNAELGTPGDYSKPCTVNVRFVAERDGYEQYQPYQGVITLMDAASWPGTSYPGDTTVAVERRFYEIPYAPLVASGANVSDARVSYIGTNALNPSMDKSTGYSVYNADSLAGTYVANSAGPWTTGVVTLQQYPRPKNSKGAYYAGPVEYLDNAAYVENLAQYDLKVGDMLLVDEEFMRVDWVDMGNSAIGIGRGVLDTIPSRHSAKVKAWRWQTTCVWADGGRPHYYPGEMFLAIAPRFGELPIPSSMVNKDRIALNYRQVRPYAPGLVQVASEAGTEPWFKAAVIAHQGITISWVGRNRLTQGMQQIDWWHDHIEEEPGTTYRLRVFIYGDGEKYILRNMYGMKRHSIEYTYDMAQADRHAGLVAVNAKNVNADAGLFLVLDAVRNGSESWQNYMVPVVVWGPDHGAKPGDPVPPYVPDEPGKGTNPNPGGKPDPNNPDSPGPDNPDENDPTDPRNPPPGNEDDPTKYGWGNQWSRGWDKGKPFTEEL